MKKCCNNCGHNAGPTTGQIGWAKDNKRSVSNMSNTWCGLEIRPNYQKGYVEKSDLCDEYKPKQIDDT